MMLQPNLQSCTNQNNQYLMTNNQMTIKQEPTTQAVKQAPSLQYTASTSLPSLGFQNSTTQFATPSSVSHQLPAPTSLSVLQQPLATSILQQPPAPSVLEQPSVPSTLPVSNTSQTTSMLGPNTSSQPNN